MSERLKDYRRPKFLVGDRALHRSNTLDSREVIAVQGDMIDLEVGTATTGWVPAANYDRVGPVEKCGYYSCTSPVKFQVASNVESAKACGRHINMALVEVLIKDSENAVKVDWV